MSTDVASVNLDNAETINSSKNEVKKTRKSTANVSVKAILGYVGSNFKEKFSKKKNSKSKKSDVNFSKVEKEDQYSCDTSQPKNYETPPLKDKKDVKATIRTTQPKNSETPPSKDKKEVNATNSSQPRNSETPPLKDKKEVQDNLSQAMQIHETKSMCVVPEEWTRPFKQGWRREIVYRGVQNPAKQSKQCDIYYFTPDNAKLRSLPMITDYLAKTNSDLTKECFSFSKQKIYSEPQEIVRNAGEKNGATKTVMDEAKIQIKNTKDFPNVKKNGTPVTRRKSRKVESKHQDSKSSTKDDSMKEDIQEILSASLPSNEQNSVPKGIKRKLEEDKEVEERPPKKILICDETVRANQKKKSSNKESSGKKASKKSLTSPTNGKRKLVEVEETSKEKSSEKLTEMCNSPVAKKRKSELHETVIQEDSLMKTFTCDDIESSPMNQESIMHCKSNESNKATDMGLPKEETELDSKEIPETSFEFENLKDKMMNEADNNSCKNSDEVVTHAANEPEKSFENVDEVVTHEDNVPEKNSFENDAVITHVDNEPEKDSFQNEAFIHIANEPEKDSFENDNELITHPADETENDEVVTHVDNETKNEVVTHVDNETDNDEVVTHVDNETENDEVVPHVDNKPENDEVVTHVDNKPENDEVVTHADNKPEKDSFQNEVLIHVANEPEKDSFETDKESPSVTHPADDIIENDEEVTHVDNEQEKEPLQQDDEATGMQATEYLQQDDFSILSENIFDEKENISETLQESNAKFQEFVEGRVLREILPEVDNGLAESSQSPLLSEQKHADVSSENSAFKEEVNNDLNEQYLKKDIAKKCKIVCNVCMHEQEIDSDLSSVEPVCEACMVLSKESGLIRNHKSAAEINNTSHSQPGEKGEGCIRQSVDTMSLANLHTIVVDENICSLLDVTKKFNLLIKDHIRLVEPGNTFLDSDGLNIRLKIPLPTELVRTSQPLKVIFDGRNDIQRLIVKLDEESLS